MYHRQALALSSLMFIPPLFVWRNDFFSYIMISLFTSVMRTHIHIYYVYTYSITHFDSLFFPFLCPSLACCNAYAKQSYMRQLLEAVHFCHVRRIVHRDLKPQVTQTHTHTLTHTHTHTHTLYIYIYIYVCVSFLPFPFLHMFFLKNK